MDWRSELKGWQERKRVKDGRQRYKRQERQRERERWGRERQREIEREREREREGDSLAAEFQRHCDKGCGGAPALGVDLRRCGLRVNGLLPQGVAALFLSLSLSLSLSQLGSA